MLPEIEKLSGGDYVFLQDGALSKRSNAYLDENCTDAVDDLIKTELFKKRQR